jgi:hypothetical protein
MHSLVPAMPLFLRIRSLSATIAAQVAPSTGALFASAIAAALHSHSCCAFKSSAAADTAAFSSPLILLALLFAAYHASASFRALSLRSSSANIAAYCAHFRCAILSADIAAFSPCSFSAHSFRRIHREHYLGD